MTTENILHHIITTRIALENCRTSGNTEWEDRNSERLFQLVGSLNGNGTAIELCDNMTNMHGPDEDPEALVFSLMHNMMTEHGMDDGRFEMTIILRPGFLSPNITVEAARSAFEQRWPHEDYDRFIDFMTDVLMSRLEEPAPAALVGN